MTPPTHGKGRSRKIAPSDNRRRNYSCISPHICLLSQRTNIEHRETHAMSPTAIISPALLDTILAPLALLFLAGSAGDMTVARHSASQMLADYNAETPEELRLAAEVITFSLHSLDALGRSYEPGLNANNILRQRGNAIGLSREAHKSQRKLDQLQRARRTPAKPQAAENAAPADPETDQAIGLIEFAKQAIQAVGKDGGKTWTQAYQQRQTAKRIAENLKKNQARAAAASPSP